MSHSEWFVSTKHRGPLHTARPTALPRLSDTSADYRLTIQYSRDRQTAAMDAPRKCSLY